MEIGNMQTDVVNETKIRVRYEETDKMGYVYYGKYFTWFEVGRTELFRKLGIPYRSFEEKGIMLPVTEADCKYKSAAQYDDMVTVRTAVIRISPVRIHFGYQIVSQDNKVLAYGSTGHAFVDETGRPVNITKKDIELWRQIVTLLDLDGFKETKNFK